MSDWIAFSSAVVALCALGVSLWQGYLARRHAIISVTPHLDIFVHTSQTDESFIEVRNGGIGPAFITSIEISLSDRKIDIRKSDDWAIISTEIQRSVPDFRFRQVTPHPPAVLASNERIRLLSFESNHNSHELCIAVREMLKIFTIRVSYASIYDIKFTTAYEGKSN